MHGRTQAQQHELGLLKLTKPMDNRPPTEAPHTDVYIYIYVYGHCIINILNIMLHGHMTLKLIS